VKVKLFSIRLTIKTTTFATVVLVATLMIGAAFVLSSDSAKHEFEWRLVDKFSALAANPTIASTRNESIKIDNNLPFYNSSHINSPYIKEYSMPKGTWPNGILLDKKGIVWTVGAKSHSLISFDPKQGRIVSEFPIKKNGLETTDLKSPSKESKIPLVTWAVVEDKKDSSIWFSQADSPNPLWRFDPSTETFDVIENISGAPYQMKVDNNTGDIWFTTYTDNKLGVIQNIENKKTARITASDDTHNKGNDSIKHYAVKEFDLGTQAFPSGLDLESTDSIWITQSLNDKLVHFKVIRDGDNGRVINVTKVLEVPFSVDAKKLFAGPYDIVVHGTDLWVTEHDANFLTKYNTNSHVVTKFPTSSNPHQFLSLPFWLRETQDGLGLWFNEHYGNRIAFFNTVDSTLTEYEVPTRNQSLGYIGNALNIAVDPADSDNKLWFSEYNHDKIGVVDRTVPIPFNIHSSVHKKVVFNSLTTIRDQKQMPIDFEITKNSNILTNSSIIISNTSSSKIIFFKASSSISPYGLLIGNATFSKNFLDLTKIKDRTHLQLLLTLDGELNSATNPYIGNSYTLGVGATDGAVTRSFFLDFSIK
jgi:streptogramin lyase